MESIDGGGRDAEAFADTLATRKEYDRAWGETFLERIDALSEGCIQAIALISASRGSG